VGELVFEHKGGHAQNGVFVVGPIGEEDVEDTFACRKRREGGRRGGREG